MKGLSLETRLPVQIAKMVKMAATQRGISVSGMIARIIEKYFGDGWHFTEDGEVLYHELDVVRMDNEIEAERAKGDYFHCDTKEGAVALLKQWRGEVDGVGDK
jgi:hypothetical protein